MKFWKMVAGAVMVLGLALQSQSAANANVILTYTGNGFTTVEPPYTTNDSVTAQITLVSPLGDNLSLAEVNPIAYSLFDGVQTITDAKPDQSPPIFAFSTNANGMITEWDVAVQYQDDPLSNGNISTFAEPSFIGDAGGECLISMAGLCPGNEASASNMARPGVWTTTTVAVPAPPLSNLAGLGVLGLVFLWRRRRQILNLAQ
jgi:MYXO-CTERM domain-containing protein